MTSRRGRLTRSVLAAFALVGGLALAQNAPTPAPVTDEALRNPPDGAWPMIRRTYSAWSYSPLDEINRENVGDLRLVWSWAMEPGVNESTPIVWDGVVYLANPGDVVQALDAATGNLIWEYRRSLPQGAGSGINGTMRGLALYEDKVILNTSDAYLVALDARTGAVVWETQVADYTKGYHYTSPSVVANGKVFSGIRGCGYFYADSCFITAHDVESGEELWRTFTIARPGEPGGDTWGDLPFEFRAGGDAWITGSFDPELNLLYWSASQAKPWAAPSRGLTVEDAALYTNSTLALNPDTGEIVWYYQYVPGESHDLDENFEFILIDLEDHKAGFMMGKHAILWHLDRETGELVRATDLGLQNLFQTDAEEGFVAWYPERIPEIGEEVEYCPSLAGFKSWRAMSYSPVTQAFYVPMELTCTTVIFGEFEFVEGGGGEGVDARIDSHHPDSGGNLGRLLALGIDGEERWHVDQRAPFTTATLTTAGGLVFVGDYDRNFRAYDQETGELLWQVRLPTTVNGYPVAFEAGGKQYVAVITGTGGGSWDTSIPRNLAPELQRPNTGNGLFVFALP